MIESTLAVEPLVREIEPAPDPEKVFRQLSDKPHCLFLDSANRDPELGRYSFVAADPFQFLTAATDSADALRSLAAALQRWASRPLPGLPPFQGGAAGLFSYDLSRGMLRAPHRQIDEFRVPALAIGLYDVVIAFDHQTDRCWIISHGLPAADAAARHARARQRIDQMRRWLDRTPGAPPRRQLATCRAGGTIPSSQLARSFPIAGLEGLTSNFSATGYRRAVQRAIDYIHAGDVFQVNLSQRLLHPAEDDSVALYLRSRHLNPATFAAYFDLGPFQIASASPERLVSLRDGQAEARPIKGTRQRTRSPEADLFAGDELRQSDKDRAENVMIVDLLRNDLSRVCQPDSVHVADLCRLEVYQYVQHLVSVVRGQLDQRYGPLDLIRATFPGGSISGAPKVRSLEIISELEPTVRGPYCGCLGYIGFDGALDLNILIRTVTAGRGWWQLPVGGAVVAQSVPQQEYEETWHKARGLIKALQ